MKSRMTTRSQSRQRSVNWVLGFGNNVSGEFGLGAIDDPYIKSPQNIPLLEKLRVKQIDSGRSHTLILTADGLVFSCGSNEQSQLGRSLSETRPELVKHLESHFIIQVCCGDNHSMALSDAGQVFVWGSNSFGQLAEEVHEYRTLPKIVKQLAAFNAVQIASGANHCMVLLNNGDLFAWGANDFGQLGLASVGEPKATPVHVSFLEGLPLSQIVCGGNHSMGLTKSGALFVWGANRNGQLGLDDFKDRAFPTVLKALRKEDIKYVVAGDRHSIALTSQGAVYTFGSGSYGQLGQKTKLDRATPSLIEEFAGMIITQVAAGRCHTACFAPAIGKVFTFGLGASGQLGQNISVTSSPVAVPINLVKSAATQLVRRSSTMRRFYETEDWSQNLNDECLEGEDPGKLNETLSPTDEYCEDMECDDTVDDTLPQSEVPVKDFLVNSLYAGGDHTFIVCSEPSSKSSDNRSSDFRVRPRQSEILTLDLDILETIPFIKKDEPAPQDIMSYLEIVLSSRSCLNASFLVDNDGHYDCTSQNPGVNIEKAQRGFKCLEDAKNANLQEFIGDQLKELMRKVRASSLNPVDIECLRIYYIFPLCHLMHRVPEYLESLINTFERSLLRLKSTAIKIVSCWYSQYNEHVFGDFVRALKNIIDHILIYNIHDSIAIELALKTLKLLNAINVEHNIVTSEEFYIEILTHHANLESDYMNWMKAPVEVRMQKLFFCDYPFVFDAVAKTLILRTDANIQRSTAVADAIHNHFNPLALFLQNQVISHLLVLKVHRNSLIDDSLRQLAMKDSSELKKPLKVIFVNEDAVDEGGVRKEFFMLLVRELVDPKFGMFSVYEEGQYLWFHPYYLEMCNERQHFFLVGIICGLAIYNANIIPLAFPLALYKKLLDEKLTLRDLATLSPSVGNGLQALLDYEGDDFEDVFSLNFTINQDNYGHIEEIELKKGGKDIMVNQKNKREYVDLYVDRVLNKSCESAFQLFSQGFYKVLKSEILHLFNANELMTLVAGKDNYDWKDLELHTEYRDEYNRTHPTIRNFWKVFHELSTEDKKKFLLFLTGTDRIPISGMEGIKMIISKFNVSDEYLPVAHTCFNHLELPKYTTIEILKTRVLQAIQHTQGFGLA